MSKTKLISVRMEEELVDLLDNQAQLHTYWTRSNIICNLLESVLTRFNDREIYDMIRFHYYKHNVVNAKFEVTDELITPKRG